MDKHVTIDSIMDWIVLRVRPIERHPGNPLILEELAEKIAGLLNSTYTIAQLRNAILNDKTEPTAPLKTQVTWWDRLVGQSGSTPTAITEGPVDAKTLAQMADVFRGIMESIPQAATLEKKALSVKEVCAYVGGITSPTYYAKIYPEVPSYTIGRRRYTLKSDIDTWLARRR